MSDGNSSGNNRLAWALAVPLVLLGGLLVIALRARTALQREPDFTVDPSRWQVMGRPSWMTDELAASVTAGISARVAGAASLLSESEMAWLSATVAQTSPWIEAVERVEPRWPAQAEIRVRLCRPVLVAEGGMLFGKDGRALGAGAVALSPAPLTVPARTPEADRIECAAAANEVLPFRPALEAEGVRLVSVAPGPDDAVCFTTDAGVELSWGRTSRRSPLAYLDLPVAARLDNLRQVLADFPGLAGVGQVRLWSDRPMVIRRDG